MSLPAMTWVTDLRGLSAPQFRILLVLAHHHNKVTHQCNPSQETLAEECEISLRSVQSHLLALEEKELIRRERIVGNMGQCAGTNYTLAIDFDQPANIAGRENEGAKRPVQPANSGASNPQLVACGNEQGKRTYTPLIPP